MVSGGRKLQNADRQMSEAFITSVFLAMSGGFQDAYTYNVRDKVFSNAQTGNVVLMSQHFMTGDFAVALQYLFPILAFAGGVFVADRLHQHFQNSLQYSSVCRDNKADSRFQEVFLWHTLPFYRLDFSVLPCHRCDLA